MSEVRVRFAPSPTGNLHVGGARTALFNWFFARRHGGRMVLRIDDTDTGRSTEASLKQILAAMKWLGLDWDEGPGVGGNYGPYQQSQRGSIYSKEAESLLASGAAYRCYCTPEEVEADREEARRAGRPPGYSGRCRNLTSEQTRLLEAQGRQPVLRLKAPGIGMTIFEDLIRGIVSFDNTEFDDFILVKSNGMPAYNFACVVDDNHMAITHVLRAEEHLSNTPRQILIYQALGCRLPNFAHLPMILAPDRSKLSKRHGATSVEEFRDTGYLPEALVNYLALLGWSPGDEREFMDRDEMSRLFDLERVSRTAAVYDTTKLTWMNGHYLREAEPDRITQLAIPFLTARGLITEDLGGQEFNYVRKVVTTLSDRVKTFEELADAADYFFSDDFKYEDKGIKKHFYKPGAASVLRQAIKRLSELSGFNHDAVESLYRSLSEELGIKTGEIIHPTRLAISGRTTGPGLFEIMVLLGQQEVINRLNRAICFIEQELPATE